MLVDAVLATCLFAVVLVVPGALLTVSLADSDADLGTLLLYGFPISSALAVLIGALLLWGGIFSIGSLATVDLFLAGMLFTIQWKTKRLSRLSRRLSNKRVREHLWPLLMVVFALSLGLLTPHWSFFVASNMDAGNYEVYGNHFLRTGSYLYESSILATGEVPVDWVESHNTWRVISGTATAKPLYFPAYPILLAEYKGIFATPLASMYASLTAAAIAAGLLFRTAVRLMGNRILAGLILGTLVQTPIFFFYSKQIMAESLALMSVALIIDIVVQRQSEPSLGSGMALAGLSAGIFLLFTAKLDAVVFLLLVPVGILLSLAEKPERGTFRWRLGPAISPAAAVVAGTSVLVLFVTDLYASHLVPQSFTDEVSPKAALLIYGLVMGLMVTAAAPILGSGIERTRQHLSLGAPIGEVERSDLVQRRLKVLYFAGAAVWSLFIIWNLFIRPNVPFDVDHDAHNLLRLFEVLDANVMVLFLVASVFGLIASGPHRPVLAILIIGLIVMTSDSRHSPSELWWMRRYLYLLVPAAAVALSAGAGRLLRAISKFKYLQRKQVVMAVGLMLVSLAIYRTADMAPLFDLEYHSDGPIELGRISDVLAKDDVVVIPDLNPSIRGLINMKRSLDGQLLLGNVAPEDLNQAIDIAAKVGSRVIVAVEDPVNPSVEDVLRQSRATPLWSGVLTLSGVNYVQHAAKWRDLVQDVRYTLYLVHDQLPVEDGAKAPRIETTQSRGQRASRLAGCEPGHPVIV